MPSTNSHRKSRVSRRQVLTSLGAVVTGSLAGCSGRVPGTGPDRLDTETTVERDHDPRVIWRYPPRDGDEDGIGYAAVELDRIQRRGPHPIAHLTLNSTIGGLAASDPYTGYRPDWFRFRLWPPAAYDGRLNHHVRVEPPGQWEGFRTFYEIRGNVRRTTVELRDVDTQGTITIPAVFDPGASTLPDRLHCSVTVQASRPGAFGRTVRIAEQGTLPLGQATESTARSRRDE